MSSAPVPVRHTSGQIVTRLRLGSASTVLSVTAADVIDPIATRVGLPAGARVMWLVLTDDPPVAASAPAVAPPGSTGRRHTLRLVDDATGSPAGAFACPR